MAKLNTSEKIERKTLKDMVSRFGGIVQSGGLLNEGITVVVVPACKRSDSEFVQVAVAQCSPGDTFKRKRGELLALQRWNSGQYISVRRAGRCLDNIADDVGYFVNP